MEEKLRRYLVMNVIKSMTTNFAVSAASMAGCIIGWYGGVWLWEEVLKDKADKAKERFSK
jgi:membrane protein DedA with SNARE-associated domain